jgi:trigger factor
LSHSSSEIQTEHFSVTVTKKPGCFVRLEIKVTPEATKAAYDKALKTINKEVLIPGFRKGKAPMTLISQQFGKHIIREWHDILINLSFQEFLKKTHLYPFTRDNSIKNAEVTQASVETGANLIIEYESIPEIPEINAKELQLKEVERHTVTPEDIDDTIHELRLRHAEWTDITDRPVQEGDYVKLDIITVEEPSQTLCKNMLFEVKKGKMGAWMLPLVLGRHVNDTVEGMSEKDPEVKHLEHFQPTHCRITIKSLQTVKLPEMDDEFVKKVGLKQVDELRPKVEIDLNKRADQEKQEVLRSQMETLLLTQHEIDIPASIIEKQARDLIAKRTKEEGAKTQEAALAITAQVYKELKNEYQLFFILRNIGEKNGIQVFEKEIQNEMLKQIMMPQESRSINLEMSPEDMRSQLYIHVLSEKVLDFLVNESLVA